MGLLHAKNNEGGGARGPGVGLLYEEIMVVDKYTLTLGSLLPWGPPHSHLLTDFNHTLYLICRREGRKGGRSHGESAGEKKIKVCCRVLKSFLVAQSQCVSKALRSETTLSEGPRRGPAWHSYCTPPPSPPHPPLLLWCPGIYFST